MVSLQRITYILINTINFLEFKDSLKEKKRKKENMRIYMYIFIGIIIIFTNAVNGIIVSKVPADFFVTPAPASTHPNQHPTGNHRTKRLSWNWKEINYKTLTS